MHHYNVALRYGRQRETTVLTSQVTAINTSCSQVKNSRGKIVPRVDLRVVTTEEVRNFKDFKRIAIWNVRTLLQCGKLEFWKLKWTRLKSVSLVYQK